MTRFLTRLPVVLLGVALFLGVLSPSLAAQSQATTGLIRGVVADPVGSPVAGATVTLRETETGFQRTLSTSDRGVFVASLLPLGSYDVSARAVGYSEIRRTGVPLRVGETVDLTLALRAVELEAVTVEATQPVVDATRIEASTRLPEEAVGGLPNNGRNFLNLTLLTPNVAIVQGPDGDELSVAGQKGINNNVAVDGADFNNPFFGEHRGGQRPPFTFNLDAVREIVVVAGGANAEFGRSSGGFVNVITKSGTNELHGSAHYYGKHDALSGNPAHGGVTFEPDFSQHQFGFTLGGPIKKDQAFFFVAYDQQVYDETKQADSNRIAPALRAWMDTAFGGALAGDYGPIARTNDARVLTAKLDYRLSPRHNLSLKYNYQWSEQSNGTFDVDSWARSADALEKDWSNAVNGSLVSYLTSNLSNEFRFQYSREDRPRPYPGPTSALLIRSDATDTRPRPFPDTGVDFVGAYRFGMPYFIPVDYHDTRIQVLDNVSIARGDHLIKFGIEYNRVNSSQTFRGFQNGRFIFGSVAGFLGYVANGRNYVECYDGAGALVTTNNNATCPGGTSIGGPVQLYLQTAGVGAVTAEEAGTQSIPQSEIGVFIQDSWKPSPRLTVNYGLRWDAQIQPDMITPVDSVFYRPFIGTTKTTTVGTFTFPSDGTIPSDYRMFQPRLGVAYDPQGDGRQVLRANAGFYYARTAGLYLASSRSTNGSRGQTFFRNSALTPILGPPPAYDSLLSGAGAPFQPNIVVFDRKFRNPRTLNVTLSYERQLGADLAASLSYAHARTDFLTRAINRNDPVFGSPWLTGLPAVANQPTGPADTVNGISGSADNFSGLVTMESSAKSRYNGITFGIKRTLDPNFQFQVNYTLSWDKSDDDNERDPFVYRYARADSLEREYNWSDRDQRHRVNAWVLLKVWQRVYLNTRASITSAQPTSERCGANNRGTGTRASTPGDRICPNGSILQRNTLRKDNAYFSWDLGLTWPFRIGRQGDVEAILQVFNVLGSDNFRDPSIGNLLFNFDGTIRSGLGDPRQMQAGLRWLF
ncbi:MAG: TonB-dependent receptor [Gemmatimonadales bacterium]